MRCLHCRKDGINVAEKVCPGCGTFFELIMRDVIKPGETLNGNKYRIDYPLGRGGFGITYRALHVDFESHVAIKEFFPQDNALRDKTGHLTIPTTQKGEYDDALRKFIREGQMLFDLKHQNIVGVRDCFKERGTAYIVMDLLDGFTLRDKLNQSTGNRLSSTQVKEITESLVQALAAIHEREIYHLDLSPDNVQITSKGKVVLIDFGAARQGMRSTSANAFKLEYAAPEVMGGKEVGPASDIFELSMMIYEMLTGKRPPSVFDRLSRDEANWIPKDVDDDWKKLLTPALKLDKSARPQSAVQWWQQYGKSLVLPKPGNAKNQNGKQKTGILLTDPRKKTAGIKVGTIKNITPTKKPATDDKQLDYLTDYDKKNTATYSFWKVFLYVVLSCAFGLAAYFLTHHALEIKSSNALGNFSETNNSNDSINIISMAVSVIFALGTFFIFMLIAKKRKK